MNICTVFFIEQFQYNTVTTQKDSDDRRVFRRNENGDLVDIGSEAISDRIVKREVNLSINPQPPITVESPNLKSLNPTNKNILGYLMGIPANDVDREMIVAPIDDYLDRTLKKMPFWDSLPIQKREQLKESYETYYIESLLYQGYNSMILDTYDENELPLLELDYLKFKRDGSRIKKYITEDQLKALVSEHTLNYNDLEESGIQASGSHYAIVSELTIYSSNAGDL